MSLPESRLDVLTGCEFEVLEYDILTLGSISRLSVRSYSVPMHSCSYCAIRWSMSRKVGSFSANVAWSSFSARCANLPFHIRRMLNVAIRKGSLGYGCTYFHACSIGEAITSSRWKISSGDPTVNLVVKRAGRVPKHESFVGDPSAKRINQEVTVQQIIYCTKEVKLKTSLEELWSVSL